MKTHIPTIELTHQLRGVIRGTVNRADATAKNLEYYEVIILMIAYEASLMKDPKQLTDTLPDHMVEHVRIQYKNIMRMKND